MLDHKSMSIIPTPLPSPLIKTEWVMVTDEFRKTKTYWPEIERAALDAARKPGWNPKTVQMGGHMMALDYCFYYGTKKVHSYKVGIVCDHPFLATLPANAPRAVKHIYKKEVRLKYLRAYEDWDFMRDANAADDAAEEYNRAAWGSAQRKKTHRPTMA